MALTPYLAAIGGRLGKLLERSSMKALQPKEGEASGLSGHVIIAGFGRVGQLIAQMLSERFIPFVALDVSASRVGVRVVMGSGRGWAGHAQGMGGRGGASRVLAGSPACLHAPPLPHACPPTRTPAGGQGAGPPRLLWRRGVARGAARGGRRARGVRGDYT